MSNRIAGLRIPRFFVRARSFFAAAPALLLLLLTAALPAAAQDDEFLQPEAPFKYPLSADEKTVTIEWTATKGYYLYKKRFGIDAATPGVKVGEPVYPKGEIHKDEYFGEQEVYRGKYTVTAPLTGAKAGDTVAFKLKWQGCADAGLCYPPSVWDASTTIASS